MSIDISILNTMLERDQQAADRLAELLEEERRLLETRQQDKLQQVIDEKAAAIDTLNYHAKERATLLQSLSLPPTLDGWDNFLQRNTQTLPLRDAWYALSKKVEHCRELNEINGKLIARSQQTVNHLLTLMRGNTPTPSLYNAKGGQSQLTSSFTVTKV
jgi:flagella synthesis protein FlgN